MLSGGENGDGVTRRRIPQIRRTLQLIDRQEVIDGIATQLEEFDPAHALLVRPIGGRYQIVSRHHRLGGGEGGGARGCALLGAGDERRFQSQ